MGGSLAGVVPDGTFDGSRLQGAGAAELRAIQVGGVAEGLGRNQLADHLTTAGGKRNSQKQGSTKKDGHSGLLEAFHTAQEKHKMSILSGW
ncbi:hypothetical protein ACFSC4_13495 [Deinococcus malanensis]|uniref:hypothetical protein n=1 Tax=Deinococcus malanensis TaxID=1706855 RepID=UPI00362D070A